MAVRGPEFGATPHRRLESRGLNLHIQLSAALRFAGDWGRAAVETRADCSCLRVRMAARRVTQMYDRHLEPSGLTITQFGLLGHVSLMPEVTIGRLAEILAMDPTTLTRNLAPLVSRDLLRSDPDPEDRRVRRLTLTAAGRAALKRAQPLWAEAQARLADRLGAEDTAALNALLDRALSHLDPV